MQGTAKVVAIIAAGGSGSRIKSSGDERFSGGKQLLSIAGKPVAAWATQAACDTPNVDEIIVVCDPDRVDTYATEISAHVITDKPVSFVAGAATRSESVLNGLAAIGGDAGSDGSVDVDGERCDGVGLDTCDDSDTSCSDALFAGKNNDARDSKAIVMIHDGARPLATSELMQAALDTFATHPEAEGVVVGHPSIDTLKRVEGTRVIETPPRSEYWAVQTPQIFRFSTLLASYHFAVGNHDKVTDDSSLVEASGFTVIMHEGPRDNIKVTCPEDVVFVEATLESRRS
jgi:2-C-methyl-D-erythritol 4-phosphate cytidylyltransferase